MNHNAKYEGREAVVLKKIFSDAKSALDGLQFDSMLIATGGFGLCGIPELPIAEIKTRGTKGADHCLEQCR
jgi:3-oxoacid CoA-transferase subunit A